MTTVNKPSKNKARKTRRAQFHRIIHTLAQDPECVEALCKMSEFTEGFYKQVDTNLRSLDKRGEKTFIKEHIRQMDSNGWITIYMPGSGPVQIKADLFDYVDNRRKSATSVQSRQLAKEMAACADAVQSLIERALVQIQPEHPSPKRKKGGVR